MKKDKPIESSTLVPRIAEILTGKSAFEEKYMFGGICFMIDDKMCVGVTNKDEMMIRINPDDEPQVLNKTGAREMDFTGRKMKGFVLVEQEGLKTKKQMEYFIDKALAYNSIAKSSKKKKK